MVGVGVSALVLSGCGAGAELAAIKLVAPLPGRTQEPHIPMAHPGGSSWLFPAGKKAKLSFAGCWRSNWCVCELWGSRGSHGRSFELFYV